MSGFRDLPARTQQRITDEVERNMATFRLYELGDIVRFAVDTYIDKVGHQLELDAFDRGVEEALASGNDPQAATG